MKIGLRLMVSFAMIALLAGPLAAKKSDPQSRLEPVAADQAIPVGDFFRPPLFANPELNPAGTHFAAIVSTKEDRLDLMTYELATKKLERLTGGDGQDMGSYDWLGDRRVVFSLVQDKLYSTGLFAADLGKLSRAHVLQRYNVMIPVGFPRTKPTQMIVWIKNSAKDDGGDGGVIKIETRRSLSGEERDGRLSLSGDDGLRADVVATYPALRDVTVVGYLADGAGELAFAVTSKDGVARLLRLAEGKWVPCTLDLDGWSIVGAGDVAGELFIVGSVEEGKPSGLYRYDAVAGMVGTRVFQDDTHDLEGVRLYQDPEDGRLLGLQYARTGPQSVWFDEGYAQIQRKLEETFPGDAVRLIGSDRARRQFFVAVSSDVRPVVYYHVDVKAWVATKAASVAPWIDPQRMRPMRTVTYRARDGKEIEGYVTRPEGVSKEKPAPLVVLPHGGPWVRDVWGWDPEVQFLASRGYAVFQPNYRGSTGYAWKFSAEDDWDFRKMHNDVTDGVKTIFKTGLIDRDRVAIMGGSFGGYLALCGAVHEEGLYRCAMTVAGVFDWERVMRETRGSEYMRGGYGVLRRKLGDPKREQAKFDAISPARQVERIKIPIFVAHGSEDVVASAAQSKRLIAELKKHGVPYEKQIERGEGHGFRKLDNQVELYTAIEAFLAKHLAPRAAASASAGASAGVDVSASVSLSAGVGSEARRER